MTTSASGRDQRIRSTGRLPGPLDPVNLKEDQDVTPHAYEPCGATEEEVNEDAAVTESIAGSEKEAAIENLEADGK